MPFFVYISVFCSLHQCLLSTSMSFVYINVFCHLQQCRLSISMSFVVYINVFCPYQCFLSSTSMSFVYINVFCRLQQCLLFFVTHYLTAALSNSPCMLDVAERHKVLSPEMCCLYWLPSDRRFAKICCLSRAERWGSIFVFSDFGTYRSHYTVPTSEGSIIHNHLHNKFCSHNMGKCNTYLLTD